MFEHIYFDLILYMIVGLVFGIALTLFSYTAYLKKKKSTAKDLIENAKNQADQANKEKFIKFREEMQQRRLKFQEEFKVNY